MNRLIATLILTLLASTAFGQVTTSDRFGFRSATDPLYGATCGVDANDDGVGINAALTAAAAVGGGVVMLPTCSTGTGQYAIGTYINLPSNTTLDCNGAKITAKSTLSSAPGVFSAIGTYGTQNAVVRNCVIDVSDPTWDGNGIGMTTTTHSTQPTHPMTGDTISGTGIPASTFVGHADLEAPFQVTLQDGNGTAVNADASGTVTLTIRGLSYSGTTVSGSYLVTGVTATTPNYMGNGNRIENVTILGNGSAPDSQYLIWLRLVQGVTVTNVTLDGQVELTAARLADGGAFSSLASNPPVGQEGLECFSCRNVVIDNIKARRIAGAGVLFPNTNEGGTPYFDNHDIVAQNLLVDQSGWCLWLQSYTNNTTGVLIRLRNIAISNVVCRQPLMWGLLLDHANPGGDFADQTVVWRNVTINNVVIDASASPRSTTKGTTPIYVRWPTSTTNRMLAESVTLSGVVVRGGGIGPGASDITSRHGGFGAFYVRGGNGWRFTDITLHDTAVAGNSAGSINSRHSDDVLWENIRVLRASRRAMTILGGRRNRVTGLELREWDLDASGQSALYLSALDGTAPTQTVLLDINCYKTSAATTSFCLNGNNTSTRLELRDVVCNWGTTGMTVCVNRDGIAATETGLTQGHSYGCYSPTSGTTFTITNPKVYNNSRLNIRQTAGDLVTFRASRANGSFAVTGGATFSNQEFCWDIVN